MTTLPLVCINDGMSPPNDSQARLYVLNLRIPEDLDNQLLVLSKRYAKVQTLPTRVGKATIAREAMMRGIGLMESELEALEKASTTSGGGK